jgi:hypothetical protein
MPRIGYLLSFPNWSLGTSPPAEHYREAQFREEGGSQTELGKQRAEADLVIADLKEGRASARPGRAEARPSGLRATRPPLQ